MYDQRPISLLLDLKSEQELEKYRNLTGRKNRNRIINEAIRWWCQEQSDNFEKKQKTLEF